MDKATWIRLFFDDFNSFVDTWTQKETQIYLCVKRTTSDYLNNGFLPIRLLLLDTNRLRLKQLSDKLTSIGFKVLVD